MYAPKLTSHAHVHLELAMHAATESDYDFKKINFIKIVKIINNFTFYQFNFLIIIFFDKSKINGFLLRFLIKFLTFL
jgi:hypothetical protein